MSQAHVVVKAFLVEPFEHVIDGLIGEGGEHDPLALLAEAFDDLGYDAGLTRARWPVDEQIVLHLHGALDGEVLPSVEVCSRWDRNRAELWPQRARHQAAH